MLCMKVGIRGKPFCLPLNFIGYHLINPRVNAGWGVDTHAEAYLKVPEIFFPLADLINPNISKKLVMILSRIASQA